MRMLGTSYQANIGLSALSTHVDLLNLLNFDVHVPVVTLCVYAEQG